MNLVDRNRETAQVVVPVDGRAAARGHRRSAIGVVLEGDGLVQTACLEEEFAFAKEFTAVLLVDFIGRDGRSRPGRIVRIPLGNGVQILCSLGRVAARQCRFGSQQIRLGKAEQLAV